MSETLLKDYNVRGPWLCNKFNAFVPQRVDIIDNLCNLVDPFDYKFVGYLKSWRMETKIFQGFILLRYNLY